VTSSASIHELSAKGSQRRAQIIATAVEMFAEKGYRASSLRELASRIGITHPGLLYHFGSKEDLLHEVLRVVSERNRVEAGLTAELIGVEYLCAVARFIRLNEQERQVVQMFTILAAEATDASHPAHEYFAEQYRSVLERCLQAFEELQEQGLLRPGISAEVASELMVAALDGLQMQWLHNVSDEGLVDRLEILMGALLTRPVEEVPNLQIEASA